MQNLQQEQNPQEGQAQGEQPQNPAENVNDVLKQLQNLIPQRGGGRQAWRAQMGLQLGEKLLETARQDFKDKGYAAWVKQVDAFEANLPVDRKPGQAFPAVALFQQQGTDQYYYVPMNVTGVNDLQVNKLTEQLAGVKLRGLKFSVPKADTAKVAERLVAEGVLPKEAAATLKPLDLTGVVGRKAQAFLQSMLTSTAPLSAVSLTQIDVSQKPAEVQIPEKFDRATELTPFVGKEQVPSVLVVKYTPEGSSEAKHYYFRGNISAQKAGERTLAFAAPAQEGKLDAAALEALAKPLGVDASAFEPMPKELHAAVQTYLSLGTLPEQGTFEPKALLTSASLTTSEGPFGRGGINPGSDPSMPSIDLPTLNESQMGAVQTVLQSQENVGKTFAALVKSKDGSYHIQTLKVKGARTFETNAPAPNDKQLAALKQDKLGNIGSETTVSNPFYRVAGSSIQIGQSDQTFQIVDIVDESGARIYQRQADTPSTPDSEPKPTTPQSEPEKLELDALPANEVSTIGGVLSSSAGKSFTALLRDSKGGYVIQSLKVQSGRVMYKTAPAPTEAQITALGGDALKDVPTSTQLSNGFFRVNGAKLQLGTANNSYEVIGIVDADAKPLSGK